MNNQKPADVAAIQILTHEILYEIGMPVSATRRAISPTPSLGRNARCSVVAQSLRIAAQGWMSAKLRSILRPEDYGEK